MGTSKSFGAVADRQYVHTFGADTGEAQIEKNVGAVADFAAKAGISCRMDRRGRAVEFTFENTADYLVVRDQIATWERAQESTHTETFEKCRPEYVDTWKFEARKLLNDAGIVHQVEDFGDAIRFTFRSVGAMCMFQTLRDTGYISKKAEATLRTEGPAAPGALPY